MHDETDPRGQPDAQATPSDSAATPFDPTGSPAAAPNTSITSITSASPRVAGIALGYGALAGGVAGATYLLMGALEHIIWSVSQARWYIPIVVMVGGLILVGLRPHLDGEGLDAQLAQAADPAHLRRRRTAALATAAIVAVACGGAIGPEAGLIAVVAELSAIVSHAIARNHAEERLIGQAGSAAALAGLYGSPPGAAAYDDDALTPPKALPFLAGVAGFVAFVATVRTMDHSAGGVVLPAYVSSSILDLIWAIAPAAVAALAAYGYVRGRPFLAAGLARVGSPRRQTLVGSLLFAGLVTAWPLLRFSGHGDFDQVVDYAETSAWGLLAALAAFKLLACALCVSSGWLGGEFFPLMLSGAAAGAATLVVVPELAATAAIAAGIGAATAVGLRKPLAALLIGALILGGVALGPLLVGVAAGVLVLWVLPMPPAAAAH